jgi:hypothetical protein
MLLSEKFSERTISNMDAALERACRLMPVAFQAHPARKFVAEKIVECAFIPNARWADGGRQVRGRQACLEIVEVD